MSMRACECIFVCIGLLLWDSRRLTPGPTPGLLLSRRPASHGDGLHKRHNCIRAGNPEEVIRKHALIARCGASACLSSRPLESEGAMHCDECRDTKNKWPRSASGVERTRAHFGFGEERSPTPVQISRHERQRLRPARSPKLETSTFVLMINESE